MSAATPDALARLVEAELCEPVESPAARALAAAIQARFGDALQAILFYGSCLRKGTDEGVLDFYIVVDSYQAAYGRGWLAIGNAVLPPNVFYLAVPLPDGGEEVRCKYAVISQRDFAACTSPACLHSYIWARFAQPTRLVYVRDAEAQRACVDGVSGAITTFVRQHAALLPAKGRLQRFSLSALWNEGLRRTYGAELRPEREGATQGIYDADRKRYERAGVAAIERLVDSHWFSEFVPLASAVEVRSRPARRVPLRWRWYAMKPIGKTLAVLRLFKTATTFGDWLPYALWKLERHSGVQVELTERQRRHPLLFAWPVIFDLIRSRTLR